MSVVVSVTSGAWVRPGVRNRRPAKRWVALLAVAALSGTLFLAGWANPSRAWAAEAPVPLGSAASYSVLGSTGVTNTGTTHLTGDLGVSPSASIVGFPPGSVDGATHAADSQAAQAQTDLTSAYNNAAARTPLVDFAGDQNGKTFTPGVYRTIAAFALTGTLTLDGLGDSNAVFIFQVDAALNTAASSTVSLVGGAQAANVFWQVNGAAGTGALSSFSGTIMAAGAITVGEGGSLTGRALSKGAVTLASNTITTQVPPAGVLSISVPVDAGNLGTKPNTLEGQSISGSLGQVQVTDSRGAPAGSGWVATVVCTNFAPGTGPAIPATRVSYTVRVITKLGTATYSANDPNDLSVATPAVTATAITGNNSAVWNPLITVAVPAGTLAGVYSATITHSVS